MPSKQENQKRDNVAPNKYKPNVDLLINPNTDDQVQVLLHLLMRAKENKLDILGIVWDDEDLGKGAYADWFDLPAAELSDMLGRLEEIVTDG